MDEVKMNSNTVWTCKGIQEELPVLYFSIVIFICLYANWRLDRTDKTMNQSLDWTNLLPALLPIILLQTKRPQVRAVYSMLLRSQIGKRYYWLYCCRTQTVPCCEMLIVQPPNCCSWGMIMWQFHTTQAAAFPNCQQCHAAVMSCNISNKPH